MKLKTVRVRNFRCLADLDLDLDDQTVLLGPNNAGKSSLLHALEFFFEGVELEPEDVFSGADEPVSVECVFTGLTDADRAAFGLYAAGEQMVLRRSWTVDGGHKLTGRGRRFPEFAPIREQTGRAFTSAYQELQASKPELGLPKASTKDQAEQAMLTWEQENPEACEVVEEEDASHLFGFRSVGNARLSDRFAFVFVPGLRDAAAEAVERRGSLLSRLLTAVADRRAVADEQLKQIEAELRERYERIVQSTHGPVLDDLGARISKQLKRYVPSAEIRIEPSPTGVSVQPPSVVVRGGEERDLTDLGRQGHGFQRAFIISALEYLAESTSSDSDVEKPTLFLAIEEPELYQHPPRARHFYRTLSRLADDASIQVCYATHSPYFVSADRFDSIRVCRRKPVSEGGKGTRVARASMDDLGSTLPASAKGAPRRYLERTLKHRFRESFFARAVLLVEGPTDEAVFEAAAELYGMEPLSAAGIVIAHAGKSVQPTALAILRSLKIPVYCVFDGDANATDGERCSECGRGKQARTAAIRANQNLLKALGAKEVDFPDTQAQDTWGCFRTRIEDEISGLADMVAKLQNDVAWDGKSPEAYGEAVRQLGVRALPEEIRTMLEHIQALAALDGP